MSDSGTLRKERVDLGKCTDRCGKRTSVIVVVERIQEVAVLVYKSCLGSSGTGVYTEETYIVISGKICFYDLGAAVPLGKSIVFLATFKQRLHTCDFKIHMDPVCQKIYQRIYRYDMILLIVERCPHGGKKMRVLGYERMITVEL